jgi:type IX secretion system PorP/SprF family membrane protein
MKYFRHIALSSLLIITAAMRAQHNSDYVQYMFNGLLLNPAYAGSHEALNLTGLYRHQWVGFGGSPKTISFTGHSSLKNKRLNIGAVVESERFGLFSHTRAGVVYAYRFPLFRGKIALGVRFGADAYSYNWNQVQARDAEDPNFSGGATRSILPEAGAGIYYSDRKFYMGLASPQLYNGKPGLSNTVLFHTGYVASLGENFKFKPVALARYVASSPLNVNVSGTFYYRDIIGLGAGYTHETSYMVFADLRLNEQLNLGYGYQGQLSRLSTYTSGSHEFMLRYLFRYRIQSSSARYF